MKNICVVTGTRAEYHLLCPLLKTIEKDEELNLILVVTGSHMSDNYGNTYKDIEADGFTINYKIPILNKNNASGINIAMSKAIMAIDEVFCKEKIDMLVLLGDRYELLSVAIVAMNYRIPISHLHGGETTEGAIDESIRHAITKMSYLHFTSCEVYRQRVIQLGESPDRVFNVGAIGIENIKNYNRMSLAELEDSLSFKLGDSFAVLTFHPVTLENDTYEEQFNEILDAIDEFLELRVIFTKANADLGGSTINQMIDDYVKKHSDRCVAVYSLGMRRYLSALSYAKVVIGNSSSGILETPSFCVPTVNIGDRQKGRIQGKNVINCGNDRKQIIDAISRALSQEFYLAVQDAENPYGDGNVSEKIIYQIKKVINSDLVIKKTFYDLDMK